MKLNDDYNWEVYTKEYSDQLINSVSVDNDLLVKNFTRKKNQISFLDNIHPNWKELYSQVFLNKAKSVFECGCGSCQHLYNISKIDPEIKIAGCDLLQTQLDFGKKLFNLDETFLSKIFITDFSKEFAYLEVNGKYDFVYTQAVIMHINHDKAVNFIRNMLLISNKNVFLVERVADHDYVSIIRDISRSERINVKVEYTYNYIDYGILVTKI